MDDLDYKTEKFTQFTWPLRVIGFLNKIHVLLQINQLNKYLLDTLFQN